MPLGTVFDTTAGRVTLISASDTRGGTRHAWFYSGIFKVGQTRGAHPITTLAPAGDKPTSARQTSAADKPALGLHVWLPAPT